MVLLPNNPGRDRRIAYGNYIRRSRLVNNQSNPQNRSIQLQSNIGIQSNQSNIGIQSIYNQNLNINWFDDNSYQGLTLYQLSKNSKVYLKENLECCICYQNDSNIVRKLKCGHEYHLDCIDTWLTKKKICPMCRAYMG